MKNHRKFGAPDDQVLPPPNVRGLPGSEGSGRFIGIDLGAEALKIVELSQNGFALRCIRRRLIEHGKEPARVLRQLLQEWDWENVQGAAISGRLSRLVALPQIPLKQAQANGFRFLSNQPAATVISIGSHGFSVLELRSNGRQVFRENNRCSQGTGNFLRQLVERFSLSIEEASALCAEVDKSAPLSGRCPVILKTDMTHLANKGENRAHILAGLFDAVCENVLVLLKPGISPKDVFLIGGVSRSPRVQRVIQQALARNAMTLQPLPEDDALFFEALGCAVLAAKNPVKPPPLNHLLARLKEAPLEKLAPLSASLHLVNRMRRQPLLYVNGEVRDLILGFDIGSTGSKAVALEVSSHEMIWEGYIQTEGSPVKAAQTLLRQFVQSAMHHCRILGIGVTGSGREIVGSLMTTCYSKEAVFILNEIAAHATGATHYDPRVDTIFEIGGQDAKYIRLAGGRVIDCAMNEACSAGTGSFIEEQGRKFAGIRNVVHLGEEALAAKSGVSLGQHCSVFMAEVIDEAVAAGVEQSAIIAGLYDSVIQNYLYRVKGSRSVGQVIFCQGMPFSSDALAAAVARQTGSQVIIPPNPGTVGALGIALLARRELSWRNREPLAPDRFLEARLEQKDTFICKATVGCGGAGNHCRIDSLKTLVSGQRQTFTWGGGCALYDKGTRKKKLPDRAPDPFRQREELLQQIVPGESAPKQGKLVALSDEFMLKGLFPFFATFLHELGFRLAVQTGVDQTALKRGIQEANVPYCAPMQLFHGAASRMAETEADFLFLPMIRNVPRVAEEPCSVTCPIVQASPDLLRWDLDPKARRRIISTVINIGPQNLDSAEFRLSCRQLAGDFGVPGDAWEKAHFTARQAQLDFEQQCYELGDRALAFCQEHRIAPVIVLGRTYTIYNKVLNSNVPAILREQGALAIPVDCYAVNENQPVFEQMYWGYGERNMRAAHQIRRTPGQYSLYCSNYSCGPDSFTLHFYSHIMEGKPFAIIETDGHAGDAGTKTRVEAFLHCVQEDQKLAAKKQPNDFLSTTCGDTNLVKIQALGEHLLIPWMGPGSQVVAACCRGLGIQAESLPMPDREALHMGRRCTSGKECLPMCLTLGGLLKRLAQEKDAKRQFAFIMPRTHGPCRLGVYHLLDHIVLERLGWKDRVRIWSPAETGYFEGTPPGFAILVCAGFMAMDALLDGLLHVRPVEIRKGAAQEIYDLYQRKLLQLLEQCCHSNLSTSASLWQVASGRLFGMSKLLAQAAREYAAIKGGVQLPTVMVVGEIYVRCDDFANDFVISRLEERGVRVRLVPFNEFLEYADYFNQRRTGRRKISQYVSSRVQERIQNTVYITMAKPLGWSNRNTVHQTLAAASPYIRQELLGEAVLTIGNPLHEWHQGRIDAVVSVGPLECLPNKIAEAQFYHIAEQEGLLSLTLSLNGEPIDPEVLNNFAFEVHARFQQKHFTAGARHAKTAPPVKPPHHLCPV